MRKIYQQEWFGIDFKSFAVLDSKNVATASFLTKEKSYEMGGI